VKGRNVLPYYKAYPRDFMEGTIGMSMEIKGAYRLVLDLIYMTGGNLRDDARWISGHLGCSVRKWESIRIALICAGKIQVKGGMISNERARAELDTTLGQQKTNAENGPKAHKNKRLPERTLSQPEPEPDIGIDTNVSIPRRASEKAGSGVSQDQAEAAVSLFSDLASEFGLPVPRSKLTGSRLSAVRARLADVGPDGWREVMAEIRASSFLTNRSDNPRGSPCSIDWITNATNFRKIIEGNYRDRPSRPTQSRTHGSARPSAAELLDLAVDGPIQRDREHDFGVGYGAHEMAQARELGQGLRPDPAFTVIDGTARRMA
jgi:uncharacterized protein YdaU (DUF1376 family)